jgi:hypothetical protein
MSGFLEFISSLYSEFDLSEMVWFTFVPEWVAMDVIVLLSGVFTVGFILKHERYPATRLLELFCFIFMYAAIYENMASVMGWYGFGESLVMVLNVPITVPLIEALFVYASLKLCEQLRLPAWATVVFAGASGVLGDLTLDPLALAQMHDSIGRWSWYIAPDDVNFFGAPVYNFTGWFLLCGFAAAFILLGRRWFERSGHRVAVARVYPPLCLLGALLMMMSPLSSFLLWLGPVFAKGGWTEYLMFTLSFVALACALAAWRGRLKEGFLLKETVVFPVVFGVFYTSNLIFACIAGCFDILLFSLPPIALHLAVYLWVCLAARKTSAKVQAQQERLNKTQRKELP